MAVTTGRQRGREYFTIEMFTIEMKERRFPEARPGLQDNH
jgi:hypothetical protein